MMFFAAPTSIPIPTQTHLTIHTAHQLFPSKIQKRTLKFTIRCSSTSLQEKIQEKSSVNELTGKADLLKSKKGDLLDFLPPIKVAKRVVLVRHGQSSWNAEGRIQGSSDFSVLTQKGEAQAETSRQMLIDDSFDVCFSSPLIRSKRTAEIIWNVRNEEMITDADLREIDLYSFQGLLKHEGKAKYGSAYRQWQVDAPNFNIDGHYPVRELWERARSCWTRILTHDSRSILVVAHNAVNQALVATAIGLGTEYFRVLLQSNCGVSVLDFTPKPEGGSPNIFLNRLNQTPNSPIAAGSSGGRKTGMRIILVCHGISQNDPEDNFPHSGDGPLNMLGVIQAQKTAELLLDLKLKTIVSSTKIASAETANTICRVQEAADCLGADCVPRYVETKQIQDLDVGQILKKSKKDAVGSRPLQPGWLNGYESEIATSLWGQSAKAWRYLLDELSKGSEQENVMVAVGHPALHIAMLGHCLNLTEEWMGTFHLDAGSISVVDFPDGQTGRGIVRCINYTAHLGRWSIPITRSTSDDEEF
ncbi:probable 2-carboxy-D-arabinitol-1-phosphatase isoform X2 [Coffea eugenioides]|uniref:probable 2-carboxy-D-arabinitol-1-phosphatase isoform X2 n=1 Tax=Coffea eugenioides TaxID=49369 RepID=UPI000F6150B8|nr:probable 2-carboxy-D-arabinitol-1-phosphatase isoform X2 [Coffea eugenioides]